MGRLALSPAPRPARWPSLALVALLGIVSGCTGLPSRPLVEPTDGPPDRPIDVTALEDAQPRVEAPSRYGNPASYVVFDRRYEVLSSSEGYVERGIASWYGSKFHNRRTSSGEPFDMYAMTAAHTTLPLPTYAEVTNLTNGRRIIVKINDRGPFRHNRLIDLSYAAALKLGIAEQGTGPVEVRAIDPRRWAPPREAAAPAQDGSRPAVYLQAGAFNRPENAQRLHARLRSGARLADADIHILPADESSPLHRVRIGPLADSDHADRLSRELLAQGVDSHLVVEGSAGGRDDLLPALDANHAR